MNPVGSIFRIAGLLLFFAAGALLRAGEIPDLENHPGKAIFKKLCVECHGENGEGVEDKADDPLVGKRDLESLAGRIERTMPEDKEDLCTGADAKQVAEYIYHAFYSVEARIRNQPVRIDLTRLTEPQYRNSVAGLVLSFRGNIGIGKERGLKAQYYGGYKFNDREDKKKAKQKDNFEKIDSRVKFDFGDKAPSVPEAKDFKPTEFSIRWQGTLIPEETGVYEFVVRTRNGATLWVNERNDNHSKTIDGWVAPNNDVREEKGSAFLIGGRPYPIRLEFFKYKNKAASIDLMWKPPHGVLETIPERNLTPDWVHESLVVTTPFPADDRSYGYERGIAVSRSWFDAVTAGAIEAADYVVDHLDELARTKKDQPERAKKIGEFGVQFAERAFRRPLTEEERKQFVDARFDEAETLEQAVKRLVLLTLTSPRFLYPDLPRDGERDQWDTANLLALALWDSLPDERLRTMALKGHLAKPEQIKAEADRMVWDWRTHSKMRGFFHHWLELDRANELAKDPKRYPEFSESILADLRTSLNLFVDEVLWNENADFRQLLLADWLFLNERLGALYGKEGQIKGGFQRVALDPKQRSGIVTHPFLLSAFAYHDNTSPIHRGVFLTRNVVGMALNPPPEATVFKDSEFDPSLTMREKVTHLTRAKACMGCHVTINPLGFSLENYDAIGRWRTKDQDKPVDASSEFKTEAGQTIKLTGARDVAEYAANQPSAHDAFIRQLFHHAVKQPMLAYGKDTQKKLRAEFEKSQFNIRELLVDIATVAALKNDPPSPTVTVADQ